MDFDDTRNVVMAPGVAEETKVRKKFELAVVFVDVDTFAAVFVYALVDVRAIAICPVIGVPAW